MKFNEKLISLRRGKGFSQEQLADLMSVSRQAVSKWEAGQTMPDLQKLIGLCNLFDVTLDGLVRDDFDMERNINHPQAPSCAKYGGFEYKSKCTIFGWPLLHVNCGCGYRVAKGVIAVGDAAIGLLSFGGLAFGGISIGGGAFGLAAVGGIALGGIALGGLSIGLLALGGFAIGGYAMGGTAVASQVAVGASAIGNTAVGISVRGENTLLLGNGVSGEMIEAFLIKTHPNLWKPILRLLSIFL